MRKSARTLRRLLLAAVLPVASAVGIEWFTVGDPGNAADTTGFGAVAYEYRVAKYEVTSAQYAEFLNAKAASDPLGLYDVLASSDAPDPFADGASGVCAGPPRATSHPANCFFAVGGTTAVGSYALSASAAGTFDQGGNASECLRDRGKSTCVARAPRLDSRGSSP